MQLTTNFYKNWLSVILNESSTTDRVSIKIFLFILNQNQQTAPKDVLNARAGTGPEITNLVRAAYQHYSLVSPDQIEKMRMDERLKVVRGLEDNTMRSACRRVNSDLATEEIMALYKLIREEAMSRRYHGQQIKDALFQPEQQPEKQFRVDRSLFLSLFKDLVPFGGGGSVGEMLAGRIWRLLAKDDQENCF